MAQPTHPGQPVRNQAGVLGITTDYPMKRTPRIPVMFIGASWTVNTYLNELSVVTIDEVS